MDGRQLHVSRRRLDALMRVCVFGMSLIFGLLPVSALAADGDDNGPHRQFVDRDEAINRFWDEAEEILGSRVGYTAQHGHDGPTVTADVGAVGLTDRDRELLRDAAPEWVDLRMFATRYSMRDLDEFGYRAEAALRDARLHGLWAGFALHLGEPDRVTINLVSEHPWAHEVLRSELPDQAFRIEVTGYLQVFPGPEEAGTWPRWAALLTVIVSFALVMAAVVGWGRPRETPTSPNPAH